MPASSSPSQIDTFLFDIGNVLVTFDFSKAVNFAVAHSHLDSAGIAAEVQKLLIPLETGKIDGSIFLERFASAIGYSADLADMRRAFQDIFEPNLPMHEVVESLQGNYRLILFSNTSDLHKDWLFAQYSIFDRFDDAIYSFVSGSMKPDDGMYEDAVQRLGVDPRRTIYLDDAPANIETGKRHGFNTIEYLPTTHESTIAQMSQLGIDHQAR